MNIRNIDCINVRLFGETLMTLVRSTRAMLQLDTMDISTTSLGLQPASLDGLSSHNAQTLLQQYGLNAIIEKKTSYFTKILRWVVSPMSLLLIAAVALSFYAGKTFDGWFILVLFGANFIVTRWHESKADQAIATLQKELSVTVQVRRDGSWKPINAQQIVPGDVVKLGVGSIVPADLLIKILNNISINEAALTGESLPKDKQVGDTAYTGSFITTGSLVGVITQTGAKTKFGKTVTLTGTKPKQSSLEKDILTITKYLTSVSLIAVVVITANFFLLHRGTVAELLALDLSILIAGIPIAMPTVMSIIISLGVLGLSRKHVIVRRLSSLEDLANVDLLLSDKTGTLTKNEILVENVVTYSNVGLNGVLKWAASAITDNLLDPINHAIYQRASDAKVEAYTQVQFTPADSQRKRSSAVVNVDGVRHTISLGAPQIIEGLCALDDKMTAKFRTDVDKAASLGYRSLALAIGKGEQEKNLTLIGILLLSDTLRPDAKGVIRFLNKNGIAVKIMTGDNRAIARRVAGALGLEGEVVSAAGKTSSLSVSQINATSVFAEVLPDDKFRIVQAAAKHSVVAATGDGVNDLPALKLATVGIAVKNSVDALKSAADIVLMTSGIGVIKNAIIESRKIFMRTYYYSIYRISESFRLVLTIAILSLLTGAFPITPIQIILLALLNDLPIIALAYDRVTPSAKPSMIHIKERFSLASVYGAIGVLQSVILFFIMRDWLHLSVPVIQTMFFLKLTVSGHLLIYVAHTKERWWKWLPSVQVITATVLTQVAATIVAISGLLFQAITPGQAVLIWIWALGWMQVAELAKWLFQKRYTV